jgi:hypothetical protein
VLSECSTIADKKSKEFAFASRLSESFLYRDGVFKRQEAIQESYCQRST